MGRDGTMGVNFLDRTGRYSTITFQFHDRTGRQIKLSQRDGTVYISLLDGTGRFIYLVTTGREGTQIFHDDKGRYS